MRNSGYAFPAASALISAVLSAAFVMAASLCPSPASATDCTPYQDFIHISGYVRPSDPDSIWARGVAVQGDYAYLACGGAGLKIIAISDPTRPTTVGSYKPPVGRVRRVAAAGDLACICETNSGLSILDVSNPAAPFRRSFVAASASSTTDDVAARDGFAYVAAGNGGLKVFDVSDPAAPVVVATLPVSGYAGRISLYGSLLFIGYGTAVAIVDISVPTAPVRVGTLSMVTGTTSDTAVSNGYAVVAAGPAGIRVFEIADPSHPHFLAHLNTPVWAEAVDMAGDHAYVADGLRSGLVIFDLSTPEYPSLITSKPLCEGWDVAVKDGYAYVADQQDLAIVRISSSESEAARVAVSTPGVPVDICTEGSLAFAATNSSTQPWAAFDLSDASSPLAVSTLSLSGGTGIGVAASGSTSYLVTSDRKFRIIDTSTPASPAVQGVLTLPVSPGGVVVSENRAYTGLGGSGQVVIVNTSVPSSPAVSGSFNTSAIRLAVMAGYAYLAHHDETGLEVFDISNPDFPVSVGRVFDPTGQHRPFDVAVSGNYAFLVGEQHLPWYGDISPGFLDVIDISNPATPSLIASLPLAFSGYRIMIVEGIAYVRSTLNVQLVDVSHPVSPRYLVDFAVTQPGGTTTYAMAGSGDNLYVAPATGGFGVHFKQCALSTSVPGQAETTAGQQLAIAPNPARGASSIRFTLDAPAHVRIDVLDVSGRRIRSLQDGVLAAGPWSINWDGRDEGGHSSASGIYFVRFQTGFETQCERLVLMR